MDVGEQKAKLWVMHLEGLARFCEENGIDREQASLIFITAGLTYLVKARGPELAIKCVGEMLDDVRRGEYEPTLVENMPPASLLRN